MKNSISHLGLKMLKRGKQVQMDQRHIVAFLNLPISPHHLREVEEENLPVPLLSKSELQLDMMPQRTRFQWEREQAVPNQMKSQEKVLDYHHSKLLNKDQHQEKDLEVFNSKMIVNKTKLIEVLEYLKEIALKK